jgi:hypothetical protein
MAAEHPAIGVQLVHHHVAEVLEEVHPLGVMRQDPRVQHVRVGEDEIRARPHRPPCVLRGVAVVGEHPEIGQGLRQLGELGELILRERLGGIEVEDAALGLLHQALQHGQVEAERLAGGGGRDGDEMLALGHDLEGLGLMRVELRDAPRAQRLDQARIQRGGKRRVDSGTRLEVPHRGDQRPRLERGQELVEQFPERHGSSYV